VDNTAQEIDRLKNAKRRLRLGSKRRKKRKTSKDDSEGEGEHTPGFAANFFEMQQEEFKELHPNLPIVEGEDNLSIDKTYDVLWKAELKPLQLQEERVPCFEKVFTKGEKKTRVTRFLDHWWYVQKKLDCEVSRSTVDPTVTNRDIILCKEGWFVRKSWDIQNTGRDTWPYDTKILWETPKVKYKLPDINTEYVDPGDKVRITVVFQVQKSNIETIPPDLYPKILEFKFSLYTTKDGKFGEPLRVYAHIDEEKFEEEWCEMTPTGNGDEMAPKLDRTRVWLNV
jgi:hypothetical protein